MGTVVGVRRVHYGWWQAWSPALPNCRYGFTRGGALARITRDLDHEWRTGKPSRFQRKPR